MGRGRKLETLDDYQRALKNRYGLGTGANYKPWLRIQDVKSKGTRSLIYGKKSQRAHHMMSSIESEHFYLAEFLDCVTDIREQFPILPLNYSQKVAKTLNKTHPTHPKTKEPIIITTDQLLTINSPQGIRYHAISIKPREKLNDLRTLEKIDIERVCWELLGVKFSCYMGNELRTIESDNINWATHYFRENPIPFSIEQIEFALSIITEKQFFIEDLCNTLISNNIISHDKAVLLIKCLISEKYIDVDLSHKFSETGVIDIKYITKNNRGFNYGAS